MLADDRNGLSRSDVVPRSPIIVTRSVEVLLDDLLSARESVAATHWEQLWQINAVHRAGSSCLLSSIQLRMRAFVEGFERNGDITEVDCRGSIQSKGGWKFETTVTLFHESNTTRVAHLFQPDPSSNL